MFDPDDMVSREAESFPASLEVLLISLGLTTTFPGWKGLCFPILLVKKVNLGEVSLSKLAVLLSVTTKILIPALFECKECVLSMMTQELNTLNRISLSRSRKSCFYFLKAILICKRIKSRD